MKSNASKLKTSAIKIVLIGLIGILNLTNISCVHNKTTDGATNYFEINYEDVIKRKKVIKLSEIASNVEYVQLETRNECLVRGSAKFLFIDSLIFVSNRDHILKFSRKGKFLKKIGTSGRGPNEITNVGIMSVIRDQRLLIILKVSEKKLIYYSFDGEIIKTVSVPALEYIKVLGDGRFIAYDSGANGSALFLFRLTNESGDTLSVVKNYDNWVNPAEMFFQVVHSDGPFYFYNKTCYFKDTYNDTVYYISGDNIIKGYFINLGKYKLPGYLRPERLGLYKIQAFIDKSENYCYAYSFQASDKIFLKTTNYDEGESTLILYNRTLNNGNKLINENDNVSGFINDWDGGVDFWPVCNINDDQVIMPINIIDIKQKFKRGRNEIVKYSEQKKELERKLSEFDDSDNPLIMIVTLKSEFQNQNKKK